MTNEQALELKEGTKLVIMENIPWYAVLNKGEVVTLYKKAKRDYTDSHGNLVLRVGDKNGQAWDVSPLHVELVYSEKAKYAKKKSDDAVLTQNAKLDEYEDEINKYFKNKYPLKVVSKESGAIGAAQIAMDVYNGKEEILGIEVNIS